MYVMICFDHFFFFFKQKTAYELRISDWSSDVCSSDLLVIGPGDRGGDAEGAIGIGPGDETRKARIDVLGQIIIAPLHRGDGGKALLAAERIAGVEIHDHPMTLRRARPRRSCGRRAR